MSMETTKGTYEIKGNPSFNAISKEDFQKRVERVFNILGEILSKSFGAYGAPTFISNMAKATVTKDGYTIAKNLIPDIQEGDPIDNAIFNMALTICSRLNYKVGDGTTTAIVAVNKIYEAFMNDERRKKMEELGAMPRDIMARMKVISEELISRVEKAAKPIRGEENWLNLIRNVVDVSSNGDENITNLIVEAYEKIGEPFINCELSKDMKTRLSIIEGYKLDLALTDEVYFNTDDGQCFLNDVDVIIFDHRISKTIYEKIITPLHNMVHQMGRKLVVIAPYYDQTALYGSMKRDIIKEFNTTHDISLILLIATATTDHVRKLMADLAILLNTEVLDQAAVESILTMLVTHEPHQILDIASRHIPEINIGVVEYEGAKKIMRITKDDGKTEYPTDINPNAVRIGFAKSMKSNARDTTFSGFYYDEVLYKKVCDEARGEMEDLVEQYAMLGTATSQVTRAQQRYNLLKLNMAVIEAGGDSDLSQNMLKDSLDDSIRASASALEHGYVLGGNLTTIMELRKMFNEERDSLDKLIVEILYTGFTGVYEQVIRNAYGDKYVLVPLKKFFDDKLHTINLAVNVVEQLEDIVKVKNVFDPAIIEEVLDKQMDVDELKKCADEYQKQNGNIDKLNMHSYVSMMIVKQSDYIGKVFDLSKKEFSEDIINSTQTDVEVIRATVDLMSILINGNQMVLTSKANFVNV